MSFISAVEKKFFGNHPRGLPMLFLSEFWERFSFYGMRALLVLYMIKAMKNPLTWDLFAEKDAYAVYGAYGALVYAFPVLGGFLADRFLGYRRAIALGGILMAIGHFLMAVPHPYIFFLALAFLCVGNGFFKPNISSTVGKLYAPGDPRRDSGFTIFYMGINFGAMLAPLICGTLGETVSWHLGFSLAGIGMICGLIMFVKGQDRLEGKAEAPNEELLHQRRFLGLQNIHLVWLGAILLTPFVALLLCFNDVLGVLLDGLGVLILIILLTTAFRSPRVWKHRLLVLIVLMFFHIMFWAFFEQAGSSLTTLADKHVDRVIGGVELKASQFQMVNPLFIVLLAPLFSMLWMKLGRLGRDPSTPLKFALAMFQIGLGFYILRLSYDSNDAGMIGVGWLISSYLLQTTGELCLSPVGLSAVTRLAPPKIVGFAMGAWFLTIAFAHHFAAQIAKLTTADGDGAQLLSHADKLKNYTDVFQLVAMMAAAAGVLLLILTPILRRGMHEGVEAPEA